MQDNQWQIKNSCHFTTKPEGVHTAGFYPLNGFISTKVESDTASTIVELMPQKSHIVQIWEKKRQGHVISYLYDAKQVLRALEIITKINAWSNK